MGEANDETKDASNIVGKRFWSQPVQNPKQPHGSVTWESVKLHIDTSGHVLNEAGVRCDLNGRPTRARGCKGKGSYHYHQHYRRPRSSTGFIK